MLIAFSFGIMGRRNGGYADAMYVLQPNTFSETLVLIAAAGMRLKSRACFPQHPLPFGHAD